MHNNPFFKIDFHKKSIKYILFFLVLGIFLNIQSLTILHDPMLRDDGPLALSQYRVHGVIGHELHFEEVGPFRKYGASPTITLNDIPIVFSNYHGALSYNIIRSLSSLFGPIAALAIYKSSVILIILLLIFYYMKVLGLKYYERLFVLFVAGTNTRLNFLNMNDTTESLLGIGLMLSLIFLYQKKFKSLGVTIGLVPFLVKANFIWEAFSLFGLVRKEYLSKKNILNFVVVTIISLIPFLYFNIYLHLSSFTSNVVSTNSGLLYRLSNHLIPLFTQYVDFIGSDMPYLVFPLLIIGLCVKDVRYRVIPYYRAIACYLIALVALFMHKEAEYSTYYQPTIIYVIFIYSFTLLGLLKFLKRPYQKIILIGTLLVSSFFAQRFHIFEYRHYNENGVITYRSFIEDFKGKGLDIIAFRDYEAAKIMFLSEGNLQVKSAERSGYKEIDDLPAGHYFVNTTYGSQSRIALIDKLTIDNLMSSNRLVDMKVYQSETKAQKFIYFELGSR